MLPKEAAPRRIPRPLATNEFSMLENSTSLQSSLRQQRHKLYSSTTLTTPQHYKICAQRFHMRLSDFHSLISAESTRLITVAVKVAQRLLILYMIFTAELPSSLIFVSDSALALYMQCMVVVEEGYLINLKMPSYVNWAPRGHLS